MAWQLWNDALGWSDVAIFLFAYASTALAITVGFHRHLTHRAFKCRRWVRGDAGHLRLGRDRGQRSSRGSPTTASTTRSPTRRATRTARTSTTAAAGPGALKGLWHAHVGWLFIHTHRGNRERYAPDLLADPLIRFVDRTFVLWVTVGLLVPFGLGYLIGGTLHTALTGLLWGGLVRMLVVHHVTYSINSLCHFFGRRAFETGDESRNLFWLAPFTFGESWHNNHHAFPTSYRHGLRGVAGRHLGVGDLGARADRPRLGRRPHQPGTAGAQGRRDVARGRPAHHRSP